MCARYVSGRKSSQLLSSASASEPTRQAFATSHLQDESTLASTAIASVMASQALQAIRSRPITLDTASQHRCSNRHTRRCTADPHHMPEKAAERLCVTCGTQVGPVNVAQ